MHAPLEISRQRLREKCLQDADGQASVEIRSEHEEAPEQGEVGNAGDDLRCRYSRKCGVTQLDVDEQAALHGAQPTRERATGECDELVGRRVEGDARAGDVVHKQAGGEMVTRDGTGGRGIDLRERITHGVFAKCCHVVVVKVEGGDAGASDQEGAHVRAARIVHVRVGGREGGEVGQCSGDSG